MVISSVTRPLHCRYMQVNRMVHSADRKAPAKKYTGNMVLNHSGESDISRSNDENTTEAANRIISGADRACIRLVRFLSPVLSCFSELLRKK